ITNLDDLFTDELGELFETGESSALAQGFHPRWSYRLLVRYRRAQRSWLWRTCGSLIRAPRTTVRGYLSSAARALGARPLFARLRSLGRTTARVVRTLAHELRLWSRDSFGPAKTPLLRAVRAALRRVRSDAGRVKGFLRAIVIRLLGGADESKRPRRH